MAAASEDLIMSQHAKRQPVDQAGDRGAIQQVGVVLEEPADPEAFQVKSHCMRVAHVDRQNAVVSGHRGILEGAQRRRRAGVHHQHRQARVRGPGHGLHPGEVAGELRRQVGKGAEGGVLRHQPPQALEAEEPVGGALRAEAVVQHGHGHRIKAGVHPEGRERSPDGRHIQVGETDYLEPFPGRGLMPAQG